jgi:hypothetical protein
MGMTRVPSPGSVRTTPAYEAFLKALYVGAKPQVAELAIPPVRVMAVTGTQPPASKEFQQAIAVLYGIGYSLKMGLKFGKLPKPKGYFDYRVGALEVLWWSTEKTLEIDNPQTLRWQAYLMVPAYVTKPLFDQARKLAAAKHPETPYAIAQLTTVKEGRAVQALHVGPYDQEKPTIDRLHAEMAARGLTVAGKHHEIYLSDPRRTPPAKLRTVIRIGVKRTRGARRT